MKRCAIQHPISSELSKASSKTIIKMKSAVYIIFLLCSLDLYIGVRSVADYDKSYMYVIASVGTKKELSCTTQTSISSNQVSWYRATNSDISRCPNQTYVFDGPSVFCDRLTNNGNVPPAFRQRFSVPPSGTENKNGLIIITRVELSDAGTYACLLNNSKILVLINFTIEDESTSTAAFSPDDSLSSATYYPGVTSTQESLAKNSSSQIVGNDNRSTDVSTVAVICFCCAAIVSIVVIVVTIVFLKRRKLKEERHEVGSLKDVISDNGNITSNNMIEPVYDEIKENGEMRSDRKYNSNDAVKYQTREDVQSISIYALVKSDSMENEKSEERRTTVTMATTDPIYAETTNNDVKQNETCKEGATFDNATMSAFNPIYGEIKETDVKQNETCKEGATFDSATMSAFNSIYGVIQETDDVPGANATYCKVGDMKETTMDEGLYSNAKAIHPNTPNAGLDGTVYTEMRKCNGDDVALTMQPPKQSFEKSIYVVIDHNGTPPHPPPPSVPCRYSCAPPTAPR